MKRRHYDMRAARARDRRRHLGRHDRWLRISRGIFDKDVFVRMKLLWGNRPVPQPDYTKSKLLAILKKDSEFQ